MLKNTDLVINKNCLHKVKTSGYIPLRFKNRSVLAYRLSENLPDFHLKTTLGGEIDKIGDYYIYGMTLECLIQIFSIVEALLKKGVKKDVLFYTDKVIVCTDDLIVAMLEYFITYYKLEKGINIFVSFCKICNGEILYGIDDKQIKCNNGFFWGITANSLIHDSFLLEWGPNKEYFSNENGCLQLFNSHCVESQSRVDGIVTNERRSVTKFLMRLRRYLVDRQVKKEAVEAIVAVVGELAPNAIEHGETNCRICVTCNDMEFIEDDNPGVVISLVILDFSEKLLWTALRKKIFEDSDDYVYKKDRIDTVKRAWDCHSKRFTDTYGDNDFYNIMTFQKISGREGDRPDGGLGISTLVQAVQKYSRFDHCYVLSGNNAVFLKSELMQKNADEYIAFNMERDYENKIPDNDAVSLTKFYFPGVAYNLNFMFEKERVRDD